QTLGQTDAHLILRTGPDPSGGDHLIRLLEVAGREEAESPGQQPRGFSGTGLLAGGSPASGYQTHAITLGQGYAAGSCPVSMAGLAAVHGGGTPADAVAVGLTGSVSDQVLFRVDGVVLRVILDDGRGDDCHVPGTGDMVRARRTGGILEVGVVHAQT